MIGRLLLPLLTCSLVVSLSSSAVAQTVERNNDRPVVDLTSAQSALTSYWALKDWYTTTRLSVFKHNCEEYLSGSAKRESMIPITTGEMKQYFESFKSMPPTVLERKILGLYLESPSRAVVTALIKNVTPIPNGAVPSARDLEERKNGQEFRYVLLKESDGWKISEVWKASTAFRPASRLYEPSPPLYPSFVYFD